MGESKSSSTKKLLLSLCSRLISRVDSMKEKELIELLALTYPYIGFVELRPVVVQIMNKCQQIPLALLHSLHEQLPGLHIQVPVRIMHQLWMFNEKDFIEALQPLIKVFILQSAFSWPVRASQHLQRTKLDEAEQEAIRSSSFQMVSGDTPMISLESLTPDGILPGCDLDLRQAYLSLTTIAISNPTSETLRMMKMETETLGPNRILFAHLFDASQVAQSNNSLIAEIITPTVTKIEDQMRIGPATNSYSQGTRREFNIPLQLLSDYIGDHPSLYASAIKYIRRLMMELQSYQLKPKPNVEFERQFPLLSTLGLLPLFTIYQSKNNSPLNLAEPGERDPIGVDPALGQILGALRFDLLMAQHDRTHTSICENDALYRFAWCLDAVRREKAVEQRHYDEMEEIFTLLHNQMAPLKKRAHASTNTTTMDSESATAPSTAKRGKSSAAASSKVSSASKNAESSTQVSESSANEPKGRPKRGASKAPEIPDSDASEPPAALPSRRDRSAVARNTIKQALGHADADYDELLDDEEKVGPARSRPKRLKRTQPTKSEAGGDKMKDGKPTKKKAKREEQEDDWSDAPEDDSDDDAGLNVDEGEDYVDFSDGEVSEESFDDAGMEENDSSYESDEYTTTTKRKRAKRTKATLPKTSTAKQASSSAKGALKVTLAGLTGTSTLASQSAMQKDSSTTIFGGIKLKRGNQVLVDTAAALSSFSGSNDARVVSSLYTTVSELELESQLNLIAEYGWIISTGSMQMTLQTVLFNILKDLSQRLSKPPSQAHCDPAQDMNTIKKAIISDKRVSRLITLLQMGFFNFPVLAGDGNDHHMAVSHQAERIIDTKVTQLILANNLSTISTKPWTKKKINPESLNQIDIFINLLSAIVILSAYFERFDSRNAMKEALKAENDDDNLEKEKARYDAMMALSSRHQNAAGDVAPDALRYLHLAIIGADESEESDTFTFEAPSAFQHPDAALSMVLFWTLTQAGSANEDVVTKIAHWVTEDDKFWKPNGIWRLLSYPTFIQEVLFGFSKAPLYSPVGNLKPIMVDKLLSKTDSQNSILVSAFGAAQLMSYLYLALSHGSISLEDATSLEETLRRHLESSESAIFSPLVDHFRSAIAYHIDGYRHHQDHQYAEASYGVHDYHEEPHEEYHPQPSYSHDEHPDQ